MTFLEFQSPYPVNGSIFWVTSGTVCIGITVDPRKNTMSTSVIRLQRPIEGSSPFFMVVSLIKRLYTGN